MHVDVLIIGAGLSGLSAGIRLAYFGKKVAIFERHLLVGGLNSFYHRNGVSIDVGLHAMTNYAAEGERSAPLNKLLRQLRLKRASLGLCPQTFSKILFPGAELRLENGLRGFIEEVSARFPEDAEGFKALCQRIAETDAMALVPIRESARTILAKYIRTPLLREMLLCPVMFYGNPRLDDMDFGQFCIMFQSLIMEGMARPHDGMEPVVSMLQERYRELGGQLFLGNGISRLYCTDGRVVRIVDDHGAVHTADCVISCCGAVETASLCTEAQPTLQQCGAGQMGFVETMFNLDRAPRKLGLDECIIFRSRIPQFRFHLPQEGIDIDSQVICMPGNFQGCGDIPAASSVRMTVTASPAWWAALSPDDYRSAKNATAQRLLTVLEEVAPGVRETVISWEMFTPKTIQRFTGHCNGAIYGSPVKNPTGVTDCDNLFICGTDQGFLGIVGSLMSGCVIANRMM